MLSGKPVNEIKHIYSNNRKHIKNACLVWPVLNKKMRSFFFSLFFSLAHFISKEIKVEIKLIF